MEKVPEIRILKQFLKRFLPCKPEISEENFSEKGSGKNIKDILKDVKDKTSM